MYIQLNKIKKHLNLDTQFTDDDNYLLSLEDVAEKVVEANIDTKLDKLEDGEGAIPSPLIQAMLLIIANFYANRESVAFAQTHEVPKSYQYLIDLYRNYRGDYQNTVECLNTHCDEENNNG